jgi:hypothetical protein
MTLCVAWIRQANDTEELVFATDSTLTGGEKWDQGIKLFEMPRKDCLLSFAGSTLRAYPLILNLVSSITVEKHLDSPSTHIEEVLKHIAELFTDLIRKIVSEVAGEDIHTLRSDARFIFGGWDWERGLFRVWKLFYSKEVEGFLFEEITDDDSKTRFYTFEIMEMDLPDTLNLADDGIYGVHLDFVRECYPDGEVSDTISERDRHRIKDILKKVAYAQFMDREQQKTGEE